MFQGQVGLADLRVLEVGIEESDVSTPSGRKGCKPCWECRGRYRRSGGGNKAQRVLPTGHAGVGEGVENGGVNEAAVVDAPTAAEHGLAMTEYVPGKAYAWPQIVLVIRHEAGLRGVGVAQIGKRLRQHLALVAHAQGEAQPLVNLPVVLRKKRNIVGGELEPDGAESLGEVAIAG